MNILPCLGTLLTCCSYCTNISCYLAFKTKRASLKFHPLTGRLVQYKQLLDQMEPMNKAVMKQVDEILAKVKEGKSVDALVRVAKKRAVMEAIKAR